MELGTLKEITDLRSVWAHEAQNKDKWNEQFDYIMDVCLKMRKAFKKYL